MGYIDHDIEPKLFATLKRNSWLARRKFPAIHIHNWYLLQQTVLTDRQPWEKEKENDR